MNKIFSPILCGLIMLISLTANAYEKEELAVYQEKYKNQLAVVLNHRQLVEINVDKKSGELEIYETDYEEMLYLKEASKFYTSKSIYTSAFFEDIVEISVKVYNKKGKMYKLSKSDFKIVDSAPSSWVFHDDDKEMVFKLKELGEGFRTVIEYKKRIKRPEFFDSFHFLAGYPVENSTLEITYLDGVELKFYEQNLENIDLVKEEFTLKKGKKKLVWKIKNLEEYKKESGSTNNKYRVPHVLAQIVSYKALGKQVDLIGTPDELHAFFEEFLLLREKAKGSNNYKEMRAVVTEITEGIETDLEKMDTIFSWVQANIKYIAFEDGINGFVPRACSEVMNNRYGDCKDMGNLLVEMLDFANVPGACVAWVGTRSIPYQMSEIPSPMTCNHVICVVEKGENDYYYLDATHAQGGYILPPRNVQGKELLIHRAKDDYTIFRVPAVEGATNYIKSIVKYRWDESDSIKGTGIDSYGGYERENRRYKLQNLDNDDKDEYVKGMVLAGYNRYTLGDYSVNNLDNKNEELVINYNFSVDNLFIEDGADLILNPTLFKPRISQYNTVDHTMTRYKRYHRTIDYQFEFELPKGYSVKFLPEGTVYKHDLFEFNSSFKIVDNTVIVNMKYYYELLEIPVDLYPDWNAFSAAVNNATIQNIILEKN